MLSDYAEVFENGGWVPYALKSNPAPSRDYDQSNHASWVRLSDVKKYADGEQADIHLTGNGLNVMLSRVSWANDVVTARYDATGATSYEFQWIDAGTPNGCGAWAESTLKGG